MTIEQKAKRYDEAFWKAGELYQPSYSALLEEIFPELIKYNDEKVRGAIIHFISHTPTVPIGRINKETMLTWLEKQNPIMAKSPQLEEQKPAWSKEDELKRSTLIHVVKKLQGSAIFEGLLPEELIDWLKSLKDRVQPQPKQEENKGNLGGISSNWSEEDEKMVNNILTPLAGRFPWNIYQPMYDWLKALKQRIGG